jgi:hypothetical protein
MATRLSKPVTRVVTIGGDYYKVTLDFAGIIFRRFRSPQRRELLLPYETALIRAAWINGDKPKRRKVKRGVSLKRDR